MVQFPKILGIDPGSRVIGFALMSALKSQPRSPKDWKLIDVGVMRASVDLAMPQRLGEIHCALFDLLSDLTPTVVAIEKSFHGVNPSSSIKLGEARGALMAAIGRHNLPIHEISPAQVKKTIAGHGAASKEQVYRALQALLKFDKGQLPMDASDALSIAFAASLSPSIAGLGTPFKSHDKIKLRSV